ncbi:MAG: AI-2E family transporter [Coriobacteriia bacterium]|nr:AI-2E family transporter [Coriobacteriia bacterium]
MPYSAQERYDRWRTTALVVWSTIGLVVLFAAAMWGLGRIMPALTPFVVAFVLVFLLNWPVALLETRGMKRGQAALLCLVILLALLGGIVTVLGPTVVHQVSSFAHAAPKYLAQADAAESAVEGQLSALVLPVWLANIIRTASAQLSEFLVTAGNNLAHVLLNFGGSIARGLVDMFLALVIAFWVLADLPKIREEITVLAGPRYESDAEHLLLTVTRVLGGYLRGQTIASLTTATLATIGLSILGVHYAIVVGIIAFFFNFAPYIGPVTTALIAGLLGMFGGPWVAVGAVAVVAIAQNLTDAFVVPRVMSSQVDLHPTLVIFSLLVGGTLFGIVGLLFAIPVAAIGKGLFVYYYERRTERTLSSTDGALFRHSGATRATADSDEKPSTTDSQNAEKGA